MVDRLNQLSQLFPGEGSDTDVLSTPTGKGVFGPGGNRILWQDWGVVQHKGPSDESPRTLEQYYVAIAGAVPRVLGAITADQRLRFVPITPATPASGVRGSGADADVLTEPAVVVATNLAEMPLYTADEVLGSSGSASASSGSGSGIGGSHGIRPGQQVLVTAIQVRAPYYTSITAYVFNMTPKALKAKITSNIAASGSSNRWKYSWVEQRILQDGQWENKPGGFTSTGESGEAIRYAFNDFEANNSASGTQGNSYDISLLPATFNMMPVRGSPVVDLFGWTNCQGQHEEHFFYSNAIEGSCP
jgi:hypothetical protein